MRLTLRTLLAYLDDILEPADREDLHRQIEASDFATDLVHRTREVSRRLRLGVPEPLGSGPVDDPNTMAEYLDNTLPMESVPEFERHCLESDEMLAEAAASHHVLAMVLGRPAEVDPETRKRVHDLPSIVREAQRLRVEGAHTPTAPAAASPAPAQSAAAATTSAPDYLRESDTTPLLRWAPALAALVLLAATAFLVLGPDADDGEGQLARGGGEPSRASAVDDDPALEGANDGAADAAADDRPADSEMPADSVVADEAAGDDGVAGGDVPLDRADQPAAPEDQESPMAASAGVETPQPPGLSEVASDAAAPGDDDAMGDDAMVAGPADAGPVSEDEGANGAAVGDVAAADENGEPEEPAPSAPTDAGRFVGPAGCVLVAEAGEDVWLRLAPDAKLALGERLISLPTYRAEIALPNGLRVELVGMTEAVVGASEEDAFLPAVDLRYGRLVVLNPTEDDLDVELLIAGKVSRGGVGAGAVLAVETDRAYEPGADVLNASPMAETHVYAPVGNVDWTVDGLRMGIEAGKQWEIKPAGGLAGLTNYEGDAEWIESLRLSSWDRDASPLLERAILGGGREVWPQLREVIEGNAFKEVRALAVRCSAAVSHPDPLVASFSDEDQIGAWSQNLGELRRLISRSSVEAERVRVAFIEKHGELLAADLFLLVRGFSDSDIGATDEEVERGALAQVIDWLESEDLACRVLANLNLEELTGRQGVFRPTEPPLARRKDVRRLRKRLKDNELRVSVP